jgi:hypothetical protein
MQMARLSKNGMVIVGVFVVVWVVMQVSGVPARPQAGPPSRGGVHSANVQPQTDITPKSRKPLSLWGTFLDTNSNVTASCGGAGCSAFSPVFEEEIACPGGVGESCTFQITIESENWVRSGDGENGESGQYRFTVDGAAPSPGPVGIGFFGPLCANCYEWMYSSPNNGVSIGTSSAVTAIVTNTGHCQKHSVEVDIGCQELQSNPSGCSAGLTLANLEVAVYTSKAVLF